eukprot:SAG11_NODE_29746_length_307_cov_1.634615_1_plen_73_part_01
MAAGKSRKSTRDLQSVPAPLVRNIVAAADQGSSVEDPMKKKMMRRGEDLKKRTGRRCRRCKKKSVQPMRRRER